MCGETADQIQEAMQLALTLMEHAGAGPTVRTAEDRAIAVLRHHALQLCGRAIERFIPRNFHERIVTAVARRPRSVFEPATPRYRPFDAHRMAQAAGQIAEQRRRIGIVHRLHARNVAVAHRYVERAPVGTVRDRMRISRHPLYLVFDAYGVQLTIPFDAVHSTIDAEQRFDTTRRS